MSFRRWIGCLTILFLFLALPLFAEEAVKGAGAEPFARGETLLKQGDLEGAYQAFVAAAKAEPSNAAYAAKAKLVRRVQALRKYVDGNAPSPKWEKMVLSLHAFYLQNAVYSEALSLDRMAHGKMKNAFSASLLAETLLETGRNREALEVLQGLDPGQRDLQIQLYTGIALARLGKVEEARAVAGDLAVPADADVGVLYDLARLKTLLGQGGEACRHLTRCFEMTPPGKLDMVKGFVRTCPDFEGISGTPAFKAAMKTLSKVKVSECSSGGSCADCPNRSGCSMESRDGKEMGEGSNCKDKEGGK